MELREEALQMPVITINYEELEAELDKSLAYYQGLVVTEETLAGCKNAQKELAGLRTKIDTYRKDKKKELSAPITAFEEQCKRLICKIEATEKPIKDGIGVYDDKKREEKKNVALQIIESVAEKSGLNDKYKSQLTVIDKYLNLTATKKAVQEDIETRAFALKIEQDREEERLNIIRSVIDSENQKLATKLSIADFQNLINRGDATAEIINEVKRRAAMIYEAENKPKEEKIEPKEEEKTTPCVEPQPVICNSYFTATFRVTGSADVLRGVSNYLKSNGITYEVLEQKRVG